MPTRKLINAALENYSLGAFVADVATIHVMRQIAMARVVRDVVYADLLILRGA